VSKKADTLPVLLKPGSTAWLARERARRETETPWRQALAELDRDELMDAAIAGAWTSKILQEELGRLEKELDTRRTNRSLASKKARPAQRLAKEQIRQEFLRYRTMAPRPQIFRFAMDMARKYPAISSYRTIQKWVPRWEEDLARGEAGAGQATTSPGTEAAAWKRRPEVFRLLGHMNARYLK